MFNFLKKYNNSNSIKIKYHTDAIDKITKFSNGDWIDLRSAEERSYKAGESFLIDLGVSIKMPKGYEGYLLPRSSTYKNYGIIITNSMGIVDESYCGEDDHWKLACHALRDGKISVNDRICQFRINKKMSGFNLVEVGHLSDESRGGFGSTGIK